MLVDDECGWIKGSSHANSLTTGPTTELIRACLRYLCLCTG